MTLHSIELLFLFLFLIPPFLFHPLLSFLLGDGVSSRDSRSYGLVPVNLLKGTVRLAGQSWWTLRYLRPKPQMERIHEGGIPEIWPKSRYEYLDKVAKEKENVPRSL